MLYFSRLIRGLLVLVAFFVSISTPVALHAAPTHTDPMPRIALVLSNLGDDWRLGQDALQLQGKLTYAIKPFTPYSELLAKDAEKLEQEIILHLPIQSNNPNQNIDISGIKQRLREPEIKLRITAAMDYVPNIVGFSNDFGSSITVDKDILRWIMEDAEKRNIYFLDTTAELEPNGQIYADKHHVPYIQADLLLETPRSEEDIQQQFDILIKKARQQGSVIGSGPIHPITIRFLQKTLPNLDKSGIELVFISQLLQQKHQQGTISTPDSTPISTPSKTDPAPTNPAKPPTTKNKKSIDLKPLEDWVNNTPAPESKRLNYSNEELYKKK